ARGRSRFADGVGSGDQPADQDRAFGRVAVAGAVVADRSGAGRTRDREAGAGERFAVFVDLADRDAAGIRLWCLGRRRGRRRLILDVDLGFLTGGDGDVLLFGGDVAVGRLGFGDGVGTDRHAGEADRTGGAVRVTVAVVADLVRRRAVDAEAGAAERGVLLVDF